VLAFLQGEEGAAAVERVLEAGAVVGAATWSEIAQKTLQHNRDWSSTRLLLMSYDVEVAPITAADAEWAAARWRRGEGLALADRLCLALGDRLGAAVWTADARWGESEQIRQIRGSHPS
jgi:ribonuclease VapC